MYIENAKKVVWKILILSSRTHDIIDSTCNYGCISDTYNMACPTLKLTSAIHDNLSSYNAARMRTLNQ